MFRTVGRGEAELEFWAAKIGNVGDDVGDFWGPNATKPKPVSRCVARGRGLTLQGKPTKRATQGRGKPAYRIGP